MAITAFYAALAGLLFVALSVRVIAVRRMAKVALGTGESPELLRRVRIHANAAEYIPIVLILMALAESLKAPSLLLHAIGAIFLAGRLLHAYALTKASIDLRVAGMALTFTAITLSALFCMIFATFQLVI